MNNLEYNKDLAAAIGLAGNVNALALATKIPRSTLYEQVARGFLGWHEARAVSRAFKMDQLQLMKPPPSKQVTR
tara:strand:- start:377 stop:598 length:222 start_codon:yes stop_codon:yes gene_type:complete